MRNERCTLTGGLLVLSILAGCSQPPEAVTPTKPAATHPAAGPTVGTVVRQKEESPTDKDLRVFLDQATVAANQKAQELDGKVFVQDVQYDKGMLFQPVNPRTSLAPVTKEFKAHEAVAQNYSYQYRIDHVGPIVMGPDKLQQAEVSIKATVQYRYANLIQEKMPDPPPGMKAGALVQVTSMPAEIGFSHPAPALRALPEIPLPPGATFEAKSPLAEQALAKVKTATDRDQTVTLTGVAKYYPQKKAWYLFVSTKDMPKPIDLSSKVK